MQREYLLSLSVGPSVSPSVTHYVGLSKNGGKWSEMTFHISTGFLFQSHTLNVSLNIPQQLSFTILFPKSSFKIILFHNLSYSTLTIFLS